jgi:hypothetical protein
MDEELAASPMMGGGCAGAGEVGEKEDKPLWSWVKMNQLIFFLLLTSTQTSSIFPG